MGRVTLKQNLLLQLGQALSPSAQGLLRQVASLAESRGWQVYLVGGAVRDLLLGIDLKQDLDLTVEGPPLEGLPPAIALAQALHQQDPTSRLQVYREFQTATLAWHQPTPLALDLTTARRESYPYPAANPQVEPSTLALDLYRRDFTINALAICLTSPHPGELIDLHGGLEDLHNHVIRALHPGSFIEDPTRIYRGVRFSCRLGFAITVTDQSLMRQASQFYRQLLHRAGPGSRPPGLGSRLGMELECLLTMTTNRQWLAALNQLAQLGALACIHPDLIWSTSLQRQLRLANRCALPPWPGRLEVILAQLATTARAEAALALHLPQESLRHLEDLAAAEAQLVNHLGSWLTPSQAVVLFKGWSRSVLHLVTLRNPGPVRRWVWNYLTIWSQTPPPLTGQDLLELGYQPGPQFREILEVLLGATLDGEVQGRTEAISFVRSHFPPPKP